MQTTAQHTHPFSPAAWEGARRLPAIATANRVRDAGHPLETMPTVASTSLFKGQKTVEIVHNGMVYTLQATKLGKLILTK